MLENHYSKVNWLGDDKLLSTHWTTLLRSTDTFKSSVLPSCCNGQLGKLCEDYWMLRQLGQPETLFRGSYTLLPGKYHLSLYNINTQMIIVRCLVIDTKANLIIWALDTLLVQWSDNLLPKLGNLKMSFGAVNNHAFSGGINGLSHVN